MKNASSAASRNDGRSVSDHSLSSVELIAATLQAGRPRSIVVGVTAIELLFRHSAVGGRWIEAALRLGPVAAVVLIGRLLILALSVFRIDEKVRAARRPGRAGHGRRAGVRGLRLRRTVRRAGRGAIRWIDDRIAVLIRLPGIVGVVGIVIRHAGIPDGRAERRQARDDDADRSGHDDEAPTPRHIPSPVAEVVTSSLQIIGAVIRWQHAGDRAHRRVVAPVVMACIERQAVIHEGPRRGARGGNGRERARWRRRTGIRRTHMAAGARHLAWTRRRLIHMRRRMSGWAGYRLLGRDDSRQRGREKSAQQAADQDRGPRARARAENIPVARHDASGHGVAAPLHAGAERTTIGIEPRATLRLSLRDLLGRHVGLSLCIGIGGGADDCARGGAERKTRTPVSRATDDRAEHTAYDGPGCRVRARWRARLYDDTLVRIGITARIDAGLRYGPFVTFVAVAISLLGALAVVRINENPLRRRHRNGNCARRGRLAGRQSQTGCEQRTEARRPAHAGRNIIHAHASITSGLLLLERARPAEVDSDGGPKFLNCRTMIGQERSRSAPAARACGTPG